MSDFKAGEFEDNGEDYEVLYECAYEVRDFPGISCEIGLRAGGGTKRILQALSQSTTNRTHIAIDPYGALPYSYKQNIVTKTNDYTNDMKHRIMITISQFCLDNPHINFVLYPMEDTEFFRRFADGVPIYENEKKRIESQYNLVYLDGPHTVEDTFAETLFFEPRMIRGGYLVYDDVTGFYDHGYIKDYLLKRGWKLVKHTPYKAAYVKE